MKNLLQQHGLQSRRYRTTFIANKRGEDFQLLFGKTDASINGNNLILISAEENYGRLLVHMETKDHSQKYMLTFSENRLFFWGVANINGEDLFIEGETEAVFKTLLDGKSSYVFKLGTEWFGEAIYPYYFLDERDITDYTSATVNYATWVTNVQKITSSLESTPISFNIDIDYCGETFIGEMTVGGTSYSWTGERVEENL